MTEWKYLPEQDYRIALWRNTIQLFHEYKRSNFIGPFKAAGFNYVDDGSFCQIFVKDFFNLKNEEQIENQHLKTELIKAKEMGLDLRKLPEIPITLLPEMKNQQEIRRGLIDSRDEHISIQVPQEVMQPYQRLKPISQTHHEK